MQLEEPIILSKKLGIYICNPRHFNDKDIIEILKKKIDKELKELQEFGKYSILTSDLISDTSTQHILGLNKKNISKDEFINSIISKLCLIEMHNEKTDFLENIEYNMFAINEVDFSIKFFELFKFINESSILSIYSSDSGKKNIDIFSILYLNKKSLLSIGKTKYYLNLKDQIVHLSKFGSLLDNNIETYRDLYILEHIIDLLIESQTSPKVGIISFASIIELLIINPQKSISNQFRTKLKMFIRDERISKDMYEQLGKLLYDVRSSLAHGNIKTLMYDLNKYSKNFNDNFNYDLSEFKKESWDLNSINILYSNIVKNLIKFYTSDKKLLNTIKYDYKNIFGNSKLNDNTSEIINQISDFKESYVRGLISKDDYEKVVERVQDIFQL